MRTVRLLTVSHVSRGLGGGQTPLWMQTLPGCRHPPWRQTPLDADPPFGCTPPGHMTWDACWEANPQTNTCENITLPQISFAADKYGQNKL